MTLGSDIDGKLRVGKLKSDVVVASEISGVVRVAVSDSVLVLVSTPPVPVQTSPSGQQPYTPSESGEQYSSEGQPPSPPGQHVYERGMQPVPQVSSPRSEQEVSVWRRRSGQKAGAFAAADAATRKRRRIGLCMVFNECVDR